MIEIKITSQMSPQEIFKMQADAEAEENWARTSETPEIPKVIIPKPKRGLVGWKVFIIETLTQLRP